MFTKANELVDAFLLPLRREQEPRARAPSTPALPGTRKEQLRRQRERLQEYLETINRLTAERDDAREQVGIVRDFADRMLTLAESAQNRALELETELSAKTNLILELSAENTALFEQGMAQAERLDLLQSRLDVLLAD